MNEDLQAFLVEAELINQKVKALAQNRMSPEEFDRLEHLRAEDKRRHVEYKERKEKEAYEAKVRGRDGKGITKDFSHFCRYCHKQYELPTPKCLKCARPTMTLQQRQNNLGQMVQDYKHNKKQRQQKRYKWQMFQKTQAAVWKKCSIDYNKKWEYFVQDSDQQPEKQPILPKNDPNFRALEMDIQQRKKNRMKQTEKAKNLKEKGNTAMKNGEYQSAMQFYTLALEHMKDIKSIYTNRALAFIKLKKYTKAIKDCTNVIQYMEVFQQVGENKDITFKAFSRRALARKQKRQFKEALEDIKQALVLFPTDKSALLLKTEIESFIKHSDTVQKLVRENNNKENQAKNQQQESDEEQTVQKSKKIEKDIIKDIAEQELKLQAQKSQENKAKQIKQQPSQIENPIKQIPKRIGFLNEQNIEYIINALIKNKQLKSIFISAKGIQAVLQYLFNEQSIKKESFLLCLCMEGDGVAEKRIEQWGILKFYQKIMAKFEDQTKLSQSVYDFIDNLFEILVPITLYEPCRIELSSNPKTHQFITKLFSTLITKFKKQTSLLDNFITFLSNLCSGDSILKNKFLKKQNVIVIIETIFVRIFESDQTKNRRILDLKQTIYSFISNIITNIDHRKAFVEQILLKNGRLNFLQSQIINYPRHAHNFEGYVENILSVLANASLDTNLSSLSLAESIFDRMIIGWQRVNATILYRSLLVISRLKYDSNKNLMKWMNVFDKMSMKFRPITDKQQKNMAQIVKILNILFSFTAPETITSIPSHLFQSLTAFVKENSTNQILFCNTCNLFGIILQNKDALQEVILNVLRSSIELLVQIAKEKTGNWRRSAAIMLGKCSFDQKCRSQIDRTHGMDVLKSIAFVANQK